MKSKFFISVSVVIIIGIVVFCVIRSNSGRIERPDKIVLISIDTCRSDHLSSYGYQQKTTPNIDKLAEEGFLFENVISPVPITLPAHSSMLTGKIPPYHGVHDNAGYILNESNVTIAEILKEQGFTTGAVVGAFVLDSQFNMDQGFDSYDDRFVDPLSQLDFEERRGDEVSRCAMLWLQEHQRDDKFFLFLHYFDPHADYAPPEPFATKFASDPYAGEISYTDHCIGQVVEKLKELNLYDSTLIIVTADHGEMLGEHGEKSHAYFIYQSAIKVPLIFKLPGHGESCRIEGLVGLIDIFPTICASVGVDIPEHVQGRDLSEFLLGKEPSESDRYLYCESLLPTRYKAHPLLGVVTDRFKYIQTSRPELYDLVADPDESNNLAGEEPKHAHLLKGRLQDILDRSLRWDTKSGQTEFDAETLRQIQSLGYVGGTVVEDFGFDPTLDDPKDLIQFHDALSGIMSLRAREKYAEATVLADKAISLCPDLPDGHMNKGLIALEQNNYSDAVDSLTRAVAADPLFFEAHDALGIAFTGLERIDEAIEHFSESLRLKPERSQCRINLGNLLVRKGRLDEAAEQFAQNIKRFPDMFENYLQLTGVLLKQGKVAEAVACSDDMLSVCPDRPDLAAKAGTVFYENGKARQAIGYWRRSLEIKPGQGEILNRVGTALMNLGRFDEAIEHFSESLRLAPNLPRARNNLGIMMVRKGRLDEAAKLFAENIKLFPGITDSYLRLSDVMLKQGRFIEAVACSDNMLSLWPDSADLAAQAGLIFNGHDRTEQAIRYWTKSLELKPSQLKVMNDLAWLKATHPSDAIRDPAQAIALAQQACKLVDYKNPVVLDTLSVAYAAAGRFNDAVQTAEKALLLSGESPELTAEIKKRLELYKASKPYRQ